MMPLPHRKVHRDAHARKGEHPSHPGRRPHAEGRSEHAEQQRKDVAAVVPEDGNVGTNTTSEYKRQSAADKVARAHGAASR